MHFLEGLGIINVHDNALKMQLQLLSEFLNHSRIDQMSVGIEKI